MSDFGTDFQKRSDLPYSATVRFPLSIYITTVWVNTSSGSYF